MFRSTSRNRKAFRTPLLAALAVALIVPAAASARPDGAVDRQQVEIPYLSHGVGITRPNEYGGVTPTNLARAYVAPKPSDGVTPTDLARAYSAPELGVSLPDGYQPQTRGDQPIIVRDAPDGYQPQTKTVEASSASGSGIDSKDLFSGFLLGAALALAAALALSVVRGGPRTAQS